MVTFTGKSTIWANYSFLIAIFLDGITLSLVFPLLNELLVDPKTSLLPSEYSHYQRELTYSIVLFAYMLCWAWGNALISSLSDIIGRKPTLLISMAGKIAGFTMLLVSVQLGSVALLVVSRVVDGLTNGVQPEAEAVGIDLSPGRGLRPTYIGYLLLPVALGDTVGSYLLAHIRDFTWLGSDVIARPIYVGLAISVVAFALIAIQFKETFVPSHRRAIDFFYPIRILHEALQHKELRLLGGIFLVTVVGWSLYFNYLESFATSDLGFTSHQLNVLLIMPGLGFVIAWTGLVRLFTHFLSAAKSFILLKAATAIFLLLSLMTGDPQLVFGLVFLAAACNSTAYVAVLGIFSNAVDDQNSGWAMGIAGALHFAAFGLSALVATPLLKSSFTVLFGTAAGILLFSALMMGVYERRLSENRVRHR